MWTISMEFGNAGTTLRCVPPTPVHPMAPEKGRSENPFCLTSCESGPRLSRAQRIELPAKQLWGVRWRFPGHRRLVPAQPQPLARKRHRSPTPQ